MATLRNEPEIEDDEIEDEDGGSLDDVELAAVRDRSGDEDSDEEQRNADCNICDQSAIENDPDEPIN